MVEQIAPFWSPNPQSFYVPKDSKKPLAVAHIQLGLGDSDIVTSTLMWNLLSVTSRLPFIWESGRVKPDDCPSVFSHMKEAQKDMLKFVGGETIHSMLVGSFHEFFSVMMDNDLSHLDLARYHIDQGRLKFVIRSRYLAKYGCKTDEDRAVLDIAKRNVWSGRH